MAGQTWEEILQEARLSADESKLLDNLVKRVPEFRDGRLRQSDYGRQSLELQKKHKEYEEAIALKDRVQGWWEEKKPIWEGLIEAGAINENSEPLWPEERKRMERELEEAKRAALAGGDMDPAELDRRVKDIVKASGGVTREELTALVASEAAKLSKETFNTEYEKAKIEMNEKTIPFMAGFSTSMATAAIKYEKETGKDWTDDDQKAVFELMAKEKNFNPREVVGMYMKPALDEKKTKAEVERLVEERLTAERKRLGYDGEQPYIPQEVSGERAQGSLQRMLNESAATEGDLETLVRQAAHKGAVELRESGKF
jgi:hypothetical protein